MLRPNFFSATRFFIASLLISSAVTSHVVAENAELSPADREFLDDLQERTTRFFWDTANRENGLMPDRWPRASPSSIAAVGFGITGYAVGVERGWLKRGEAAERVVTLLRFLKSAPQHDQPGKVSGYRGLFYHFLDMETGDRYRKCELSSIDTALLMGGVLFCREYFSADTPIESEIREVADQLYRRVEWNWMQPRAPLVAMGWHPETQEFGRADYQGYNEAMLLYILALGSPTHPIDAAAWNQFTSTYEWANFQGQEHINFSPLFGHQYSHIWIDFRGIDDEYTRRRGIDYFENSRRATLSQQAYAVENRNDWKDYGETIWGLTACDGPTNGEYQCRGKLRRFRTYWARGVSQGDNRDDGTIAPTAAGGSIPFAPQETITALRTMKSRYGERLYAQYGFLDCFNPSVTDDSIPLQHGQIYRDIGWVDGDYLGIDQGPILLMAENYRSELIWSVMKRSPYLRAGLRRAGFQGGWLDATKKQ